MTQKLIYGAMHLGGTWDQEPIEEKYVTRAHAIIEKCMSLGIDTFDHADIYTFGKSEAVFGQAFKNTTYKRQEIVLQTKASIELNKDVTTYNMTGDYIKSSLEASLKRLQTDYVDVFLLHRPDPLMDVVSLRMALQEMKHEGQFKALGVSNMNHHQIDYLQNVLEMPITMNQLQMSLKHHGFVDKSILVNHPGYRDTDFPEGTLEYCMKHDIELQAWGASDQGFFNKDNSEGYDQAKAYLKALSKKIDTTVDILVLKWLMRHPASIAPLVGTTNVDRLENLRGYEGVNFDRQEWYDLLYYLRTQQIP
jgi:predicted oxidoreductase